VPLERSVAFGPFDLDPIRRILRRDGEPVALAGKPLDLLILLVGERGRTVERDELLSRIWPDVVVEEANLTQNVSVLRKALGEGPGQNEFIVTVPGRGYRFVADLTSPVEAREPQLPGASAPATAPPRRLSRIAIAVASVGVAAFAAMALLDRLETAARPAPTAAPESVAVLPVLSGEPGAPADAEGIALADGLIARLTAAGFDVRPTRAILEFADPKRDTPEEAGTQLGVETVVTGAVRELLGTSRLSLQAVRSADGALLWAETVDVEGTLPAAEDRLLDAAAERIAARLAGEAGR